VWSTDLCSGTTACGTSSLPRLSPKILTFGRSMSATRASAAPYLRIAETWDPEDAKKVRDLLNVAAADSGDHSTSDEFIKRLEKRLRAKKRPLAPAVERRA
jgi:hypothetical protein